MLGAAPTGRRAVLLFAVALAVGAAAPASSQADTVSSRKAVWALEVTPHFASSIRRRRVARAKNHGINALALNRHLSRRQERRARSLARRFDLRVFALRRRPCTREVKWCAVVAPRRAAVERLARRRNVDMVVLRLRGPRRVPRLVRMHELAAAATTIAPLMLLPRLRAEPTFPRR